MITVAQPVSTRPLPAAELVADLQPAAPAMTAERYTLIILLSQKYFGNHDEPTPPFGSGIACAISSAEQNLLRRLFGGASDEEDVELWHELCLAHRIALIGGKLQQTCGMADATNSQVFAAALAVAQIEYLSEQ